MCQPAVDLFLQISLVACSKMSASCFVFLVIQLDEEKVFREGGVSGVQEEDPLGSA